MSNTVVDVFCENYVLVDWEAHALWIAGHGVTEAVALMREKGIMNEYPGVTQDLLVSDLNDQGRRSRNESFYLEIKKLSTLTLYVQGVTSHCHNVLLVLFTSNQKL